MVAPGSLPSNELVRACLRTGTPELWEEFVRRFQPAIAVAVLHTARAWGMADRDRVEDLVQEVFWKLFEKNCRILREFVPQGPDSIVGYLKTVAVNIARDQFRAGRATKRGGQVRQDEELLLDSLPAPAPGRSSGTEWHLQVREIKDALDALVPSIVPERDRTIFWLYFKHGYTAREISLIGALGLSEKGVESVLHRVTREIRSFLGNRPPPPSKGFPGGPTLPKESP